MADEIHIRAQLSFANSGRSAAADSGEISVTQTGTKHLDTVQTVGIVEEPLLLGEVPPANAHYLIENLDATNPVDLKPMAGVAIAGRIMPGGVMLGRFGATVTAPVVIAITAPVDIHVLLIQA